MAGSIYGTVFKISTWGESHGKALGVVIDGCPAGLPLSIADVQQDLDRRKPNSSKYSTKRNESDSIDILSGVFEGITTGTPISMAVFNKDQRSADYSNICESYRPGHADYGYDKKFGIRDYRGGGRSSGRETLARVAAGAVARKVLLEVGIEITAYTKAIGNITCNDTSDLSQRFENSLVMPDKDAAEKAELLLDECMSVSDSVGGVVECIIKGVRAGIGQPVFDKLDAEIAKAVFSIGGVKGVEFGAGFDAAKKYGSENNDGFYVAEDKSVYKYTNNSGGILGGISDGDSIVFRAAFKPTPSIAKAQKSINKNCENIELTVTGRHDPIIVPRAVVVVEAMAALVVVDLLMQNTTSRIEYIKKIYN